MKPTSITALASRLDEMILFFCAGFEDRAARAAALLAEIPCRPKAIVILTYPGAEHGQNLLSLKQSAEKLNPRLGIHELDCRNRASLDHLLKEIAEVGDSSALDVTGLARVPMLEILSHIANLGISLHLIYTEAEEYYPQKSDFDALVQGKGARDAFPMLNRFEDDEIVYSSQCALEDVPSLRGKMYANYPLMLITFLTFKRGRVSVILQSFEANSRVLIKGIPRRDDLKWRASAIGIPNADLLEDGELYEIDTLDWEDTYVFLKGLYEKENNKYKFNFVLAPLGSKMQTVGAWKFAHEHRDIRVISSTPKRIFHDKYSSGYRNTFVFQHFIG